MGFCEVCEEEFEELFQCIACAVLFCENCGNQLRGLCGDCFEHAETSRIDNIEEE